METFLVVLYLLTAYSMLKKESRQPTKQVLKAVLWPWFALKALASWLGNKAWGG